MAPVWTWWPHCSKLFSFGSSAQLSNVQNSAQLMTSSEKLYYLPFITLHNLHNIGIYWDYWGNLTNPGCRWCLDHCSRRFPEVMSQDGPKQAQELMSSVAAPAPITLGSHSTTFRAFRALPLRCRKCATRMKELSTSSWLTTRACAGLNAAKLKQSTMHRNVSWFIQLLDLLVCFQAYLAYPEIAW